MKSVKWVHIGKIVKVQRTLTIFNILSIWRETSIKTHNRFHLQFDEKKIDIDTSLEAQCAVVLSIFMKRIYFLLRRRCLFLCQPFQMIVYN